MSSRLIKLLKYHIFSKTPPQERHSFVYFLAKLHAKIMKNKKKTAKSLA